MAVTDLHDGGSLEELATLPAQGVTSYKLFMAYKGALMVDDETLFRTMQVARETGALVMVHAENGDAIDVLVKEALAAGNTAPVYHALTRPPELEGEATNRAIQLAHIAGAPLYVVHVSCKESVDPIAKARRGRLGRVGRDLHAVLLRRPDLSRAARLRGREVRLHAAASRRSRTRTSSGTRFARTCSRRSRPTTARSSGTGRRRWVATTSRRSRTAARASRTALHMIHEFGVRGGRITLNRMVELLATNPAKLFGLYPRKGTIAPGSDADIVIFDPNRKKTITAADQHSKSDYNLYEGTEVTGDVDTVLVRGTVVVDGGELKVEPGFGQFVARAKFGEELA